MIIEYHLGSEGLFVVRLDTAMPELKPIEGKYTVQFDSGRIFHVHSLEPWVQWHKVIAKSGKMDVALYTGEQNADNKVFFPVIANDSRSVWCFFGNAKEASQLVGKSSDELDGIFQKQTEVRGIEMRQP